MLTQSIKAAVVCAALGGGILHLYLSNYEREMRGGELVGVVSVSRDVSAGAVLTEADVDERSIPERYLDARHVPLGDLARVVGNRVLVDVAAGDALLWTDVGVSETHTQLSGLVAPGRRAVRIAGDHVSFGGLLRPGDRVDVLLTSGSRTLLEASAPATETLLENLLVLAVGDSIGGEGTDSLRTHAAVTLSVLPPQAEMLEAGRRRGELGLVLRNPSDLTLARAEDGTPSGAP